MDSSAKTSVGSDENVETLLLLSRLQLRLNDFAFYRVDVVEESSSSDSISTSALTVTVSHIRLGKYLEITLSLSVFGSGNHLHGFGNLLNILYGFQTNGNILNKATIKINHASAIP